ncbi:MAG TPA: response regulator transcription factor [Acidimicrobiales bacterium]|nr:response regulator transcription factor [Acidimicrobiales bacterium]
MPLLLLVEDDDAISVPLAEGLRREGFEVLTVRDGASALAATDYDAVLLDLGLPDIDGTEVCRALRERSGVPIIVISARGEEAERVSGLELGADDYLVKPFGLRELVARIRSVMRRRQGQVGPDGPQRIGVLEIDRRSRRVRCRGHEVVLTAREFDLLAFLADDPGAVVSRQDILDHVWDPLWYGTTKTIDVHVASLRRKLGDPKLIETSRGVGFRLVRIDA